MTTDMSILNHSLRPDDGVYPSGLDTEMTLSNAKEQMCIVMPYPTGTDIGFQVAFSIPQDYSGSPVLVIKGVIDGTPANVISFGAQQLSREDSEAIDTAYETEDVIDHSTWTGYADEDMFEITLTVTPAAAYEVGDTIFLWFYRNDSSDDTTFNFLLTDLIFRYAEA